MSSPRFDIWICEGRLCSALGADTLKQGVAARLAACGERARRCRVLRGGCYGVCELSANVVVRRWPSAEALPDPSVDRLTLTGSANEVVYSRLEPRHLDRLLAAHLDEDTCARELTREAREAAVPARTSVAERIRQLRQKAKRSDG